MSRPSSVSQEALDEIPQRQILEKLDLPPSPDDVTTAVTQTSSGKSPGVDGIPAEILKHDGTKHTCVRNSRCSTRASG